MALATCAICGHKVSTTARSCPECGALPPKLVYCTRCGGTMLESATVCPACGAARYDSPLTGSFEKQGDHPSTANQPTAVPPPRSTTKEAATSQPKWQCPECRSENVQRLSVIYSEGSISSTQKVAAIGLGDSSQGAALGGAAGQVFGTSSSILATNAAPPTAPRPPDTADNSAGIGCLVFVLVGFLALSISGVIAEALSDHYPNASPGGLFLLVVGISVSLGVWASGSASRAYKQSQDAKRQPELAAYNQARVIYNEAMAKWQRSYFCHRCGNIFELQSSPG
jgi:DNA-directed RNA polymerase subunit RPC12/RpoP